MEETIPNFPLSYLEFGAEEIFVEITPLFNHPPFLFISYTIGPIISGLPIEVPLWFAISLRKRGRCKIRVPDWLTVACLEKLVKEEGSEHQRSLSILPFQFIELSNLFLTYCKEDIDQSERVAALIQDLTNIRDDRIRLGVRSIAETIQSGSSVVSTNLHNVASMEIFAIRQFFLGSMDAFLWLKAPEEDEFLFGSDVVTEETMRASSTANATTSNNTSKLRRFRK